MKIRVSLVERHYGYIDIDVPENSHILDPNVSLLKKRRAAKKLAEHEITEGDGIIIWPEENVPCLDVELGYTELEEEDT